MDHIHPCPTVQALTAQLTQDMATTPHQVIHLILMDLPRLHTQVTMLHLLTQLTGNRK